MKKKKNIFRKVISFKKWLWQNNIHLLYFVQDCFNNVLSITVTTLQLDMSFQGKLNILERKGHTAPVKCILAAVLTAVLLWGSCQEKRHRKSIVQFLWHTSWFLHLCFLFETPFAMFLFIDLIDHCGGRGCGQFKGVWQVSLLDSRAAYGL